jgi:hypothetical protein
MLIDAGFARAALAGPGEAVDRVHRGDLIETFELVLPRSTKITLRALPQRVNCECPHASFISKNQYLSSSCEDMS